MLQILFPLQPCLPSVGGGIIAGFSSPYLERDEITFPRSLNIHWTCEPRGVISIRRCDVFPAFLSGIRTVICVGVLMLPQRRTHKKIENTEKTEKHISHIVEGLWGLSSRCEHNYFVIDRQFAGVQQWSDELLFYHKEKHIVTKHAFQTNIWTWKKLSADSC